MSPMSTLLQHLTEGGRVCTEFEEVYIATRAVMDDPSFDALSSPPPFAWTEVNCWETGRVLEHVSWTGCPKCSVEIASMSQVGHLPRRRCSRRTCLVFRSSGGGWPSWCNG